MKKIRKTVCLVLSVLTLFSLFALGNISAGAKAKPKLSKTKITIKRGKTFTLKLKHAKASKVRWTTSKRSVAQVKNGKITAVKKGKATITAGYRGKKYKCKVTVSPRITHFGKTFTVYKNDTIKLLLKNTKGHTYKAKAWKTSNKNIVTISKDGVVSGKQVGTVTITAVNNYGDEIKGTVKVIDPFNALKEYITANGKTDSEGSKYISYSNNNYSYFITYNSASAQFEFQGEYTNADNSYDVIMYMNHKGSKTLNVISRYMSDDQKNYYTATANVNASAYNTTSPITFTLKTGNTDDNTTNEYSNLIFNDSFSGWCYMLNNRLNMGVSALGFSKYK